MSAVLRNKYAEDKVDKMPPIRSFRTSWGVRHIRYGSLWLIYWAAMIIFLAILEDHHFSPTPLETKLKMIKDRKG